MENHEAFRERLLQLTLEEKQNLYRDQLAWVKECETEVLDVRFDYSRISSIDNATLLHYAELHLANEKEELDIIRRSLE